MAGQFTTVRGRAVITVTGVEATIAALKTLDKAMYKRLDAQLRRAALVVARQAAASAPVGATGAMRGGYRVKRASANQRGARKFQVGYKVVNLTREGSILEFAGSTSGGSTQQGRSLITTLFTRYGAPGRFAWAAFDRNESQLEAKLTAVVREAEAEVQARLNEI
jgi:hypothetical protein